MRLLILVVLACLLGGCAPRRLPAPGTTTTRTAERSGLPAPPDEQSTDKPSFPPGVTLDKPLSSDETAAIALWNNARLRVDMGALGIAKADLIDAGLLRNPRLDLLLPVGAKPFELLLNLPIETLIQRPKRIAASQAAYEQLILRGSEERLVPMLMTAAATALALLPIALGGNKPGHEIEHPMAVVILGGLFTSTVLNLFVMPALSLRFARSTSLKQERS
jgi:hypothetical protein